MKRIKPAISISIVLIALVGLVLAFSVYAQKIGITISPLTFELTTNPGDIISNKLKVYNPTDNIMSLKMEVEDFTAVGETGQVMVEPAETETYSLAKWVTTEPTEFTLEPKEQKFVDFTITVPENAEPGGKYGSVLASTTGVIGEEVTGAALVQKVGALILLTVAGEVTEDLTIQEFSVPNFSEYGPIPFVIRFENTGTVHVRPRGFVTVTNWQGRKVADIEFPQLNVIPGAVRRVEASWSEKWHIGRYTATLIGSYGTINIPLTPVVLTFWVFPWKVALAIFLGILVVLIFFYKTRKRWKMALKILLKGE